MTLITEKGTASGQIDFIEKLYDFISANAATIGWNALELTTISSQRQATIQIGSECYFTFSSATDDTAACRLYFRAHTSFTSGVVWKSQSGGAEIRGDSNNCGNQAISAPISSTFAYYFYAATNYFIFILSIPTGYYQAGIVGKLSLFGTASYGYFSKGTANSNLWDSATTSKYDYTTFDSWSATTEILRGSGIIPASTSLVGPSFYASLCYEGVLMGHAGTWLGYNRRAEFVGGAFSSFTSGINDANGITAYNVTTRPFEISGSNITAPLIPEIAYIPHPTISGRYAPFGTVPGVLFTNIKNLENEELITIGTDIYRVFPSRTRNVAHAGQYWGIAVLSPAE